MLSGRVLLRLCSISAVIFAAGCAANNVRQINMTPSAPGVSGTYDFDILADTTGNGCSVSILGFRPVNYSAAGSPVVSGDTGKAIDPISRMLAPSDEVTEANSAAAYDALTKVPGSDVLLVTRTKTNGFKVPLIFARYCSDLSGKAIRLKKGPTIVSTSLKSAE